VLLRMKKAKVKYTHYHYNKTGGTLHAFER